MQLPAAPVPVSIPSERLTRSRPRLTNGASPLNVLHDFANNSTTQFAASFSVSTLDPDGFTTGRLTGLDISDDGLIRATYSNGIQTPMGQVALADFANLQGLNAIGGSA